MQDTESILNIQEIYIQDTYAFSKNMFDFLQHMYLH